MRIGLIVYGLDRPLTGIGRYTLELLRALSTLRPRPDIVLLAAGGLGPLAQEALFPCARLPGCGLLPGLVTLGNVVIPAVARRLGLEVVHDPTGVTPLLLSVGRFRTIVTVHDTLAWSFPGHSSLLDTLIYRRWLPRVLPRVDAVVTDSQVSRSDIGRFLHVAPDRINVVPAGVSTAFHPSADQVANEIRKRYRLPERFILFVGSAEKRKNLGRLLQAHARLQSMGQSWPLVIVGARQAQRGYLREPLREPGLQQNVILAGFVPEEDLPAVYAAADLLVYPSLYEGFGLPPLEAMACGTPVVCSSVASLPEVVGDAALTVDPYNVEGLAEAMSRALTDIDLRAVLRVRGLARAQQFTWEHTAQAMSAIYEDG